MNVVLQPWHLLFAILSGWMNRRQQDIIAFQNAQINALMQQLGRKRILLTDDQRRLLAVKGKAIGRKALRELTTIVTPDTILRWHRELVAKKWDHSEKRKAAGRPRIRQVIVDLILRFANENPSWGYDRIQGALANVGYHISDTTVGNVLKANGIEPAPDRKRQTTWKSFLKAHWDVLAAIDFTTIEVWSLRGLVTYYLLFVIDLKTRRVELAGSTTNPDGRWMTQIARNLTDADAGFLCGKQLLIMDRDPKFCRKFRETLESAGTQPFVLPSRSPNLNSFIERFFRSLKEETLSRMIFFNEVMLRTAVRENLAHYHAERNHQGLGNELIDPADEVGAVAGKIACRKRLGGMLRYYYRDAA